MIRRQKWMLMGAIAALVVAYLNIAFIAWDLAWPLAIASWHPMARMVCVIFGVALVASGARLVGEMLDRASCAESWDKYRDTVYGPAAQFVCDVPHHDQQRTNDSGDPGPFAQTVDETKVDRGQ